MATVAIKVLTDLTNVLHQ